jgi:hypothetical protein
MFKKFLSWVFKPSINIASLLILSVCFNNLTPIFGVWTLLIAFVLVLLSACIEHEIFNWKVTNE